VLLVVLPVFFPAHVLPDLLVALQELRADLATTNARIGDAFHEAGCAIVIMIVATGQTNIIPDAEILLNDLLVNLQELRADLATTSARIRDAFHEDGYVIMIMIVATGQTNIIPDAELLNDLQCDLLNRLEDLGVTILLGEAQRMVTDAPMEDVSQ